MAKNGNGAHAAPLEGLRAQVCALQARLRALDTERTAAQGELDRVIADRPELAAAAHARHEPGAADQLKLLNTRALEFESVVLGLEHESAKVRAELVGAQAALEDTERRRRLEVAEAEAAALAAQIDQGLSVVAQRWAEFKAAREALYVAQQERITRLGVVNDVLNEMGGVGTEGHAWPPHETLRTVDTRLAELTAA